MSEYVDCPHCQSQLVIPGAELGKKARCPTCEVVFVIGEKAHAPPAVPDSVRAGASPQRLGYSPQSEKPIIPPPSPAYSPTKEYVTYYEDRADENKGSRRGGKNRRAWRLVRKGLSLYLAGIYIGIATGMIGACISGVFQGIAAASKGDPNELTPDNAGVLFGGMIAASAIQGIGGFASLIMNVLGQFFFLFAPRVHGAKLLAAISLFLWCLGTVFSTAGVVWIVVTIALSVDQAPVPELASLVLPLSCFGLSMAAQFMHIIVLTFFLRAAALAMKSWSLAASIWWLNGLLVAIVLAVGLMVGLVFAGGGLSGSVQNFEEFVAAMALSLVCGCFATALLSLGWTIWFIVTVARVRGAVIDRIGAD